MFYHKDHTSKSRKDDKNELDYKTQILNEKIFIIKFEGGFNYEKTYTISNSVSFHFHYIY